MNEKTDTKYMPMASKSNSTGIRFHFLQVTAEQTQRFLCCTRGGSSRDLLVWMLLLNTARVCRTQTIKFSPRWRFGVEIDQKTADMQLKSASPEIILAWGATWPPRIEMNMANVLKFIKRTADIMEKVTRELK